MADPRLAVRRSWRPLQTVLTLVVAVVLAAHWCWHACSLQIVVSFVQLAILGAALGLGFGLVTSFWLANIWNDPGG
jgi:hypothetical protein